MSSSATSRDDTHPGQLSSSYPVGTLPWTRQMPVSTYSTAPVQATSAEKLSLVPSAGSYLLPNDNMSIHSPERLSALQNVAGRITPFNLPPLRDIGLAKEVLSRSGSMQLPPQEHRSTGAHSAASYVPTVPPTPSYQSMPARSQLSPNSTESGGLPQGSQVGNATFTPAVRLRGTADTFSAGEDGRWGSILENETRPYYTSFTELYDAYRQANPGNYEPMNVHYMILTGYRVAILQYLRVQSDLYPDEAKTLDTMKWGSRGAGCAVQVEVSQMYLGQEYIRTVTAHTSSQKWPQKLYLIGIADRYKALIRQLVIDVWLGELEGEWRIITRTVQDPSLATPAAPPLIAPAA